MRGINIWSGAQFPNDFSKDVPTDSGLSKQKVREKSDDSEL
jgi:hypothetical protein